MRKFEPTKIKDRKRLVGRDPDIVVKIRETPIDGRDRCRTLLYKGMHDFTKRCPGRIGGCKIEVTNQENRRIRKFLRKPVIILPQGLRLGLTLRNISAINSVY